MNFAMLEIQSMQKNKLNCTDYTARLKFQEKFICKENLANMRKRFFDVYQIFYRYI